jgi:hypothetical protein
MGQLIDAMRQAKAALTDKHVVRPLKANGGEYYTWKEIVMGIADVRNAFNAGLAGKASCKSATMEYVRNPETGANAQLVKFVVAPPDAVDELVTAVVPPGTDIVKHARALGEIYAKQLEQNGE